MLIEIWAFLAIFSIITFIIGLIFAKSEKVQSGRLVILLIAFLFQIATAINSFEIEILHFGSTTLLTQTIAYDFIAVMFVGFAFINLILMTNIMLGGLDVENIGRPL